MTLKFESVSIQTTGNLDASMHNMSGVPRVFHHWFIAKHALPYMPILCECFHTSFPANNLLVFCFFYWDSLHARLNSHYEAWSCKKKKHIKIKAYRKSNLCIC